MLLEFGEESLCLLISNGGVDNDIITLLPVDGSGNLVLITELQGVDDTENFVERSADLCGVRDGQADNFPGVDDEYCSDLLEQ